MRAVRLGSYSIVATTAGTPIFSRFQSTTRYRCLWPPPRNRDVIRPKWLRPPVHVWCSTSLPRGLTSLVTSLKSDTEEKRRGGDVGLKFLTAIVASYARASSGLSSA